MTVATAAPPATLHVPDGIDDDAGAMTAALAYAAAGWYVLPIGAGSKRPAAELGRDWGHKSSRDPDQIAAWFAGTSHGIGLHVGRSGVAAFDVDHPEKLPEVLARAIIDRQPPAHATRDNVPGRAHYLFRYRGGRVLGNGTGRLGGAWGDIRGRGGQIVVAPTAHADGGHYHWLRTGEVPELPDYLDELLSDAAPGSDAATDAEVRAFLDAHTGGPRHRPELLDVWIASFREKSSAGESRHQRMISIAAGALSEARAGYYPARLAMDRLEEAFLAAVTAAPVAGSQQKPARSAGMARAEWAGISAWAVAQAQAADLEAVRTRAEQHVPDPLAWLPAETRAAVAATTPAENAPDPDNAQKPPRPAGADAELFFSKHDGLLVDALARAVCDHTPIGADPTGTLWSYRDGLWTRGGEQTVRVHVARALGDKYRAAHAANIVSYLSAQPAQIQPDQVRTDLLNVANGMLDWRTGQLHPHDPSHGSITQIPVPWRPDAACPATTRWLHDVFAGDQAMVDFALEVAGYALYGDNPLHKAVLLHGSGRNGKGTWLRLLTALLGRANISGVSPQALDENRFSVAELHGKLANLIGDVDPRTFTATETFKQVTGGDLLLAERKYGQPFHFTARALMIAAFNALPRTADTSEGFFARWLVVPFTQYFPPEKADPRIEQQLHSPAELEGLLRLSVDGLRRLMARGKFDPPQAVTDATALFRRDADPVRSFLSEYAPGLITDWQPRHDVYRAYTEWAGLNGHRTMSAGVFYERVAAADRDVDGYQVVAKIRQGTRGLQFLPRIGRTS